MVSTVYCAPGKGAKYYNQRVCVCLRVCLAVRSRISQTTYVQALQNFLYVLPAAVVRPCSDASAMLCTSGHRSRIRYLSKKIREF